MQRRHPESGDDGLDVEVAVGRHAGARAEAGHDARAYLGVEHTALEAEARTYLDSSVARRMASGGHTVTAVRQGRPAAEIAAAAREGRAAMVNMVTHGRTGVARTLLGSVAGAALHASPSPVMLIHPRRTQL